MVNQETGLRGYLVSGDTAFLEPYRAGYEEYRQSIGTARRLTSDNPQQQVRLDRAAEPASTWRNDIAELEIALMADPATRQEGRVAGSPALRWPYWVPTRFASNVSSCEASSRV